MRCLAPQASRFQLRPRKLAPPGAAHRRSAGRLGIVVANLQTDTVSLQRSVMWLFDGFTAFVLSGASTVARAASHSVAVTRFSI